MNRNKFIYLPVKVKSPMIVYLESRYKFRSFLPSGCLKTINPKQCCMFFTLALFCWNLLYQPHYNQNKYLNCRVIRGCISCCLKGSYYHFTTNALGAWKITMSVNVICFEETLLWSGNVTYFPHCYQHNLCLFLSLHLFPLVEVLMVTFGEQPFHSSYV